MAVGDVVVLPVPDAPGQGYVHRVASIELTEQQPPCVPRETRTRPQDAWTLRVTYAHVPLVIWHVAEVGRAGLWLSHRPIRIGVSVSVVLFALVALKSTLLIHSPRN